MPPARFPSIDRRIAGACALTAIACAASYGGLFSHAYPGDTGVYEDYGRALVENGRIPYRDFFDEYPPGSVPVFALPAILWNAHYLIVFKLWMTACAVGFTACSGWVLQRLGLSLVRLLPIAVAPVLAGPVFLNRYDPFAALVVSLALVALLRGKDRSSAVLLGIGTAVKLYPAVVLPLLARRVRSLRDAGIAFVVAAAVLVLPFFLLAPGGVGFSLWTQLRRHLQIESLGASILLVGSNLGIHHVQWIDGKPGSIDLGGHLPDAVGFLASVTSVALVLLVARAYWKGADDDARLVTAWAAAIAGFTIFGKVLSPQYLTWLIPLVPLAAGRRGLLAAGTLVAALALSMPEYLFWGRHGLRNQDWTVWLLLARNLLLVAVFWLLYSQLRQREAIAKPS
ncbi:MAG TPA: glycosyltransferase family 87 protein [Gaiellaceae bacterium]